MDLLSETEMLNLLEARNGLRVSLFTHTVPSATTGNVIRLKNLLRAAEEKLAAEGQTPEQARALLQPARDFAADGDWWREPAEGLALFLSADRFSTFRLPYAPAELAVVGSSFHLRPLLPMFTSDGHFHVLALSQNEVRLLRGSRMGLAQMELDNVPKSLAEILANYTVEGQVRIHTGAPQGQKGYGAVFTGGHGAAEMDNKDSIREFFRSIDRGVHELLQEHNAPLVLAGVGWLLPLYHEVNTYPQLVKDGVPGNPEGTSLGDLHMSAWALVAPLFDQDQNQICAQYELAASKDRAVHLLEEAVPAAHEGRLASLLVPLDSQLWGTYSPETGEVQLHADPASGDLDLIDYAAVEALSHGTKVYALPAEELPAKPVAGILRY